MLTARRALAPAAGNAWRCLAVDLRRGIDAITEVRGIVADDLRRSVNELLRIFFLNSHGFPEDRQLHRARVARLAEISCQSSDC